MDQKMLWSGGTGWNALLNRLKDRGGGEQNSRCFQLIWLISVSVWQMQVTKQKTCYYNPPSTKKYQKQIMWSAASAYRSRLKERQILFSSTSCLQLWFGGAIATTDHVCRYSALLVSHGKEEAHLDLCSVNSMADIYAPPENEVWRYGAWETKQRRTTTAKKKKTANANRNYKYPA